MPDDQARAAARIFSDGRLNLEQQRKRAKELHRDLLAGDEPAAGRLAAHHPKGTQLAPPKARLADAQLVLARENGFPSWPRLKSHIAMLDQTRSAMERPNARPDTERTLHIRCGSDIVGALRRAGFVGHFHEFADPFCQGPVRDLPRPAFIAERASFVAQAYGIYPQTALARLEDEYAGLTRLDDHDEVVLWFEHDSYDQLILAFLLAELPATLNLSLICADRAPGVRDFIGLGQLAPEVIRLLWERRVVVERAHHELGAVVWRALRAPSPEALQVIAARTPAVPPMAGALQRQLRELPALENGLSLTEQIALDLLADGPLSGRTLFARLTREREPLPFLGDAMFWSVLRALAAEPDPLILAPPTDHHEASWAERKVTLTPLGDAVRRGLEDRLAREAPVRWVGGIEIAPRRPAWRWDEARTRVVLAEPRRTS